MRKPAVSQSAWDMQQETNRNRLLVRYVRFLTVSRARNRVSHTPERWVLVVRTRHTRLHAPDDDSCSLFGHDTHSRARVYEVAFGDDVHDRVAELHLSTRSQC
jgi:hypothetical protein